jgi:hypothetical protein
VLLDKWSASGKLLPVSLLLELGRVRLTNSYEGVGLFAF